MHIVPSTLEFALYAFLAAGRLSAAAFNRALAGLLVLVALGLAAPDVGAAPAVSGQATVSVGGGELIAAKNQGGVLWVRHFKWGVWRPWRQLPGAIVGTPRLVSWGANRADVFVRSPNNGPYQRTWNGVDWTAYQRVAGFGPEDPYFEVSSDVVPISWGPGRIDLFARAADTAELVHNYSDGGSVWSGWERMGGTIQGNPSAVSWGAGHLDVYVRGGTSGPARVFHKYFQGGAWWGYDPIGIEVVESDPIASSWAPGRVDVWARGQDTASQPAVGDLRQAYYGSNTWNPWASLGGSLLDTPSVVSWGVGHYSAFARGSSDEGLYEKTWDQVWAQNGWSSWTRIGAPRVKGTPAAVSWGPERTDVVAEISDPQIANPAQLGHVWRQYPGGWSAWRPLGIPGVEKVDTAAEGDEVIQVLRGETDAAGQALYAGLSQAEQTFLAAHTDSKGWRASRLYGGGNWTVDTPGEAGAFVTDFRSLSTHAAAVDLYLDLHDSDEAAVDQHLRSALSDGSLYINVMGNGEVWRYGPGTNLYEVPNPTVAADLGLSWGSAQRITSGAIAGLTRATVLKSPTKFTGVGCQGGLTIGADSKLGIAVPKPSLVVPSADPSPVKTAFEGAMACVGQVAGASRMLRTQIPIDAWRRTDGAIGPDGLSDSQKFGRQLIKDFATLLKHYNVSGVVTIRAHDFDFCDGRSRAPYPGNFPSGATLRTSDGGLALGSCQYPSEALYTTMFTEVDQALRGEGVDTPTRVLYSAWNEPDHSQQTLRWIGWTPSATGDAAKGDANKGAEWAGKYWLRAALITGADRVLAGEFASNDRATLQTLAGKFNAGAGRTDANRPKNWALHTYKDMGDGTSTTAGQFVTDVKGPKVNGSWTSINLWQTENAPKFTGAGLWTGSTPDHLHSRGAVVRSRLSNAGVRVFLYEPFSGPGPGSWDSGLADPTGRARAFMCGLGGIVAGHCSNSVTSFATAGSPAWVGPNGL